MGRRRRRAWPLLLGLAAGVFVSLEAYRLLVDGVPFTTTSESPRYAALGRSALLVPVMAAALAFAWRRLSAPVVAFVVPAAAVLFPALGVLIVAQNALPAPAGSPVGPQVVQDAILEFSLRGLAVVCASTLVGLVLHWLASRRARTRGA